MNKLWFPLFIIGLYLISIGLPKISPSKVQISASPLPTPVASSSTSQALITYVVDGDTVDVQISGQKDVVRIIGINSPEVGACFANEATIEARNILQGKSVTLEADSAQDNRDIYNRLLRYVFLSDGTNFGQVMIKNGFAKEYIFKTAYKYQSLYLEAQKYAKQNKLGLWADNACLRLRSDDGSEREIDR